MFVRTFFSNGQKRGILNKQNEAEKTSFLRNACVAQLVEQRIRNAQVIGSSPITSSKVSVRVF